MAGVPGSGICVSSISKEKVRIPRIEIPLNSTNAEFDVKPALITSKLLPPKSFRPMIDAGVPSQSRSDKSIRKMGKLEKRLNEPVVWNPLTLKPSARTSSLTPMVDPGKLCQTPLNSTLPPVFGGGKSTTICGDGNCVATELPFNPVMLAWTESPIRVAWAPPDISTSAEIRTPVKDDITDFFLFTSRPQICKQTSEIHPSETGRQVISMPSTSCIICRDWSSDAEGNAPEIDSHIGLERPRFSCI